jgi:hypothetical protein
MADEAAKQYVVGHYNPSRARASGVGGSGIFIDACPRRVAVRDSRLPDWWQRQTLVDIADVGDYLSDVGWGKALL